MTDKNDTLPDKKDIVQDNFSLKNEKKKEASSKTPNYALRVLLLLLLFLSGLITGIYFLPALQERLPFIAEWVGENDNTTLAELNGKILEQQSAINDLTKIAADQERRLNQLSSSQNATLSDDIERRIGLLEENLSIDTQENTPNFDASQSNRIDMLLSRMSQLEASFIPLSKNMFDGAQAQKEREALQKDALNLNEKLALLENRLATVETQAARDNTGLLLNLKIAELKKKVVSGEVYEKELETIRTLIETGSLKANNIMLAAIEELEKTAQAGLVTPDQLKRSFNGFIPDLISASNIDTSASWWQNTLSKLQNMISVRRTETSTADNKSLDGMINDIESWLNTADFNSILQVVDTLPTALQELLTDWKADVENWINGEEAIETLESTAAESYLVSNIPSNMRAVA
ncbi:COG4223 family protein [Pseudemcibacter sp.]|uniref:COG4223 family protein n=1 Tax=Pseudemcibacter sp. TaxID=2943293 RepID=UPI003F69DB44